MSNNNNINQVLSDVDSTEEPQYNGYGDIIIPEFNGHNDDIIIQEFNGHNDEPVYSSSQDDGLPTVHVSDNDSDNDSNNDNDSDNDSNNDSDNDEDNDENESSENESSENESSFNDSDTSLDIDTGYETHSDTETNNEEKSQIITGVVRSTQTETHYCGICYTDLTIENNVTSKCNHHFCNTCFFRWIEVNATCPNCRASVDSNTNLTDEQLHRENKEVYKDYTELLIRHCHQVTMNKKKLSEMYDLREKTNSLLQRQISLREQMCETEGYNEGYMTAAYQFFHGDKIMKVSTLLDFNRNKRGFMNGYQAGMDIESRRLNKLAKKFKRIPKKNIKIKKRRVQKTLWDCGITNNDDIDPLERVTTQDDGESDRDYFSLDEH